MKILRQLLREFWLPLTLGVAWTLFNVADKPLTQWTFRHTLNILGPTFFFFSWLVAQWYRVSKQQHVESELTNIRAGVKAIQEPIFPCALFVTVGIDAPADDVKRVFGAEPGYNSYGPDQPMPPPPQGLPQGVLDARLFHYDKFLDYRNGRVEAAGIFNQEHPGYNLIHRPVSHTVSQLASDTLAAILERSEPLLGTPQVRVELYLTGRPHSPAEMPSLMLAGAMPATQVKSAWALDESVFVDMVCPLSSSTGVISRVGTSALEASFLRVVLEFCYVAGLSDLPESSWPTLHNLQLWFRGASQLLTFTTQQLESQVTRENPEPIVRGGAKSVEVIFEYAFDPVSFAGALIAVA